MERRLVQSHGTIGYEVGTVPNPTAPDKPLVVVQTKPYLAGESLKTIPAHLTTDATPQDANAAIRAQLAGIIEQATFLGLDGEALRAALDAELARALG
jgi:hypothetical protein